MAHHMLAALQKFLCQRRDTKPGDSRIRTIEACYDYICGDPFWVEYCTVAQSDIRRLISFSDHNMSGSCCPHLALLYYGADTKYHAYWHIVSNKPVGRVSNTLADASIYFVRNNRKALGIEKIDYKAIEGGDHQERLTARAAILAGQLAKIPQN